MKSNLDELKRVAMAARPALADHHHMRAYRHQWEAFQKTFDPPTVLALIAELQEARRERDSYKLKPYPLVINNQKAERETVFKAVEQLKSERDTLRARVKELEGNAKSEETANGILLKQRNAHREARVKAEEDRDRLRGLLRPMVSVSDKLGFIETAEQLAGAVESSLAAPGCPPALKHWYKRFREEHAKLDGPGIDTELEPNKCP